MLHGIDLKDKIISHDKRGYHQSQKLSKEEYEAIDRGIAERIKRGGNG